MKNKIISTSGITLGVVILLGSILFISPDAKSFIISNLPEINLIKPDKREAKSLSEKSSSQEMTDSKMAKPESKLAPSVLFKDGDGKTIDISKQKGKVLFINFWATWCPPCIAEMPSIAKLRSEIGDKDILFLMVDVDNNYKKSKKFMDNHKYNLPVYSPAGLIPSDLLSGSIPTTVIIDKEGRVVGRHEGGGDYSRPEVVKFFKELINN
ncbi:TlpA disulfide reductase family protein [Daejeonella sp.]|uniref:TlpA family protein disulfide reductase n=1 Tax=Daejeonella sp. TaxID=2805397 RepID=UPI00272F8154|nr:TlpA disulfide reductase family protein [Daejeonella sp.]MDP2415419.1 TlpA disulfide reductase family protein [Daejeonella sp.]